MDFQLNIDSEPIGRLAITPPLCVAPDTSVQDTLRQMREKRSGSALVVDGDTLQGIFTERDGLQRLASGQGLDAPVTDAMASPPVTVTRDDSVGVAIERMSLGRYRHLPVVDSDGAPLGVLSVRAILTFLVEHVPQVVYTLPPEPHHHPDGREGA